LEDFFNLILDKDGKKMSKSRGNTIDPIELFDKYGADAVRLYALYVSPPWVPTRFDVEGLREIESKFFRSYKNTYNFFQLYSGTDEIDPREFFVDYDKRPEIDRWILSRFNNLLKMYSENMDKFEVKFFDSDDFANGLIEAYEIFRQKSIKISEIDKYQDEGIVTFTVSMKGRNNISDVVVSLSSIKNVEYVRDV